MRRVIYLSLGSNLGARESNLARGIDALQRVGIAVEDRSSIYETEPVGLADQPWFLNQVIRGETDQTAVKLLEVCKGIEREIGRTKSERFGPRILDIDILLYGEDTIREESLQIPHPRMNERRFVLVPLVEIAPGLRDPRSGEQYAEILKRLDEGKKVFQSLRNES